MRQQLSVRRLRSAFTVLQKKYVNDQFSIFFILHTQKTFFLFVYGPAILTVFFKLTGLGTEALEVETKFSTCLRGNAHSCQRFCGFG